MLMDFMAEDSAVRRGIILPGTFTVLHDTSTVPSESYFTDFLLVGIDGGGFHGSSGVEWGLRRERVVAHLTISSHASILFSAFLKRRLARGGGGGVREA